MLLPAVLVISNEFSYFKINMGKVHYSKYIVRSVLHKVKYFNFRWIKVAGSCQDGPGALDARWNLVAVTKNCA